MKYVTIDPYYDLDFYNETLDALRNNKVRFSEYISIKNPFLWYFEVEDDNIPKFINFDFCPKPEEKFLISKVYPCIPSDEVPLFRRHKGNNIWPYVFNDCFQAVDNYCCLFNLKSKEQGTELSKSLGRIYYLGKYYSNKYRLCLTTNPNIRNFVPSEDILSEIKDPSPLELLRMEADFNFKILYSKERIKKFSMTPYFEKGIFEIPSVQVQDKKKYFTL